MLDYFILSEMGSHPVMVFPIGNYKTAKYAKLKLTMEMAQQIIENFDNKVLGATEPFIDSSGKHDEAAPAAGWIKRLFIAPWEHGEALFADVEWTSEGTRLVREKLYRYLSAVIAPHVIPETGEKVWPVLRSMTLTNVPVLRMMPAIQASESGELAEVALSELVQIEEEAVMTKTSEESVAEETIDSPAEASVEEVPEAIAEEQPEAVTEEEQPVVEEEESPPVAEIEQAQDEDLIEGLMTILDKLNAKVRYKRGAPALRSLMREAIAKAKVTAASEGKNFDVASVLYSILAELDESGKEMNTHMDKLIEKFGLSEDASEDDVIVAFDAKVAELSETNATLLAEKTEVETKLTEAETRLAEIEAEIEQAKKDAHVAEIEHRLADAIASELILPSDVGDEENPGWLRELAFSNEAVFDKYLDSRGTPAVDTSEIGSGEDVDLSEDEVEVTDERADVKLARLGREYAAEHPEVNLAEAQNIVRREDKQLDADYRKLMDEVLIRR